MSATLFGLAVTEPGVYEIPEDAYHRDPVPVGSLSSGGARKLLPPSCPARYAYEREHPPASTQAFDFGKAAHLEVLGSGAPIEVIAADNWMTKAAREQRDAAYAAGFTPVLTHEHAQVKAMADAIEADPHAGPLFDELTGNPEQSLFWVDTSTGMWCRARLDWLPRRAAGRRLIVPDYKTCRSASLDALQRDIYAYGYHQQAEWYLRGVRALGLDDDPAFVFVAQEKTPPYLVTTFQLDRVALRTAARRNDEALAVFAECTATGYWPAYADDIPVISLPAWANTEEY